MSADTTRARWLEVHDELLRGVSHALSNRVATVSATAYMLEHDDVTGAQAAESLRIEAERMDGLLQLLRLLPARDDHEFEPVMPIDVVTQAVALHAHHCDLRDTVVQVELAADVLPLWVEPHALLESVLLALTAAKRAAFELSAEVRLTVHGDSEQVIIAAGPATADPATLATSTAGRSDTVSELIRRDVDTAAACLRSAHGAAAARTDGGIALSLPTLPAARRMGR